MSGVEPSPSIVRTLTSGWSRLSRRGRIYWVLSFSLMLLTFAAASLVLRFNQPYRFVIEAQTEVMRLPSAVVGSGDAWSVRGAEICEEYLSGARLTFICREPSIEDEVIVIPDGAGLTFQQSTHTINATETGSPEPGVHRADTGRPPPLEVSIAARGGTPVALYLRGQPAPSQHFSGNVVLRWQEPPTSPLDFRGLAIIGQLPEQGNRGILTEGRASAHMAARSGAPRFEIAGERLVSGDVVSVRMPQHMPFWRRLPCRFGFDAGCLPPEPKEMWGFVRFGGQAGSGFTVVYAGPAETVVVDRLGANFELRPGFVSQLLLDPLAQLLYACATFLAMLLSIFLLPKTTTILFGKLSEGQSLQEGSRDEAQHSLDQPGPPGATPEDLSQSREDGQAEISSRSELPERTT